MARIPDTDGAVALGKPTRVVVSADRGYVVVPAVYTFKAKGLAMRETAQMVYALQKGTTGWQISAWTWAGSKPKPVTGTAKLRGTQRSAPGRSLLAGTH
jgi:hypothetical protein